MMEYLIHITLLFSIVFTIVVGIINSTNPALLESLKTAALACIGLIGVVIYFFTFAYLEEVTRVLRIQRIQQHGGYFIVIVLPPLVISLLAIPALVLELAVPGYGWLPWMFIAGAVWRVVFFVFFRVHKRIRAILLPDPKREMESQNTSTKGLP